MMPKEMFPILQPPKDGPRVIPWAMIAPHEKQAWTNHGQTLSRLAERGGLDVTEAVAVLSDKPWKSISAETARAELLRLVADFENHERTNR